MDYTFPGTGPEAVWGGFISLGFCTFWGLRWFLRGLRGDICDSSGMVIAGRSWFIVSGLWLQLPLIGYTYLVWKQGFFCS
jgi:hypothetical protein